MEQITPTLNLTLNFSRFQELLSWVGLAQSLSEGYIQVENQGIQSSGSLTTKKVCDFYLPQSHKHC